VFFNASSSSSSSHIITTNMNGCSFTFLQYPFDGESMVYPSGNGTPFSRGNVLLQFMGITIVDCFAITRAICSQACEMCTNAAALCLCLYETVLSGL
jgi:hypothetical protein